MNIIGVHETLEGDRIELTVTIPDKYRSCLSTGDADRRIAALVSREAETIAHIVSVAKKDRDNAGMVHGEPRGPMVKAAPRAADAGPDQIAFVGTDEAVEVGADGKPGRALKAGTPKKGQ